MPLPASVCTAGEVACMDIWEMFLKSAICMHLHLLVLYIYMLPSSGSAARQDCVDYWQQSCLMQRCAAESCNAC